MKKKSYINTDLSDLDSSLSGTFTPPPGIEAPNIEEAFEDNTQDQQDDEAARVEEESKPLMIDFGNGEREIDPEVALRMAQMFKGGDEVQMPQGETIMPIMEEGMDEGVPMMQDGGVTGNKQTQKDFVPYLGYKERNPLANPYTKQPVKQQEAPQQVVNQSDSTEIKVHPHLRDTTYNIQANKIFESTDSSGNINPSAFDVDPEEIIEANENTVLKATPSKSSNVNVGEFKEKLQFRATNFLAEAQKPIHERSGVKKHALESELSKVKVEKKLPDFSKKVESDTASKFNASVIANKYKYGQSHYEDVKAKKQTGKGFQGEEFIDCSGAVTKVLSEEGLIPEGMSEKAFRANTNAQMLHSKYTTPSTIEEVDDGDLITMGTGDNITHVGFIVKDQNTGKLFIAESSASFGESRIVPLEQRVEYLTKKAGMSVFFRKIDESKF